MLCFEPEYVHVHVCHQQLDDATIKDLNDDEHMVTITRDKVRLARHFVDFTGDGLDQSFLSTVE